MKAMKTSIAKKTEVKEETKFSKEQLLSSDYFTEEKDLVDALLGDGEYAVSEVEKKIKQYKKGEVN